MTYICLFETMDSSRLKAIIVPALIACLIPVIYRAVIFVYPAEPKSLTEAVTRLEKRITSLETEARSASKLGQEVNSGLHTLQNKLELMEALKESERTNDDMRMQSETLQDTDVTKLKAIIRNDQRHGLLLAGISVIQFATVVCVILLFTKMKTLNALIDRRQSDNSTENNCTKDKVS